MNKWSMFRRCKRKMTIGVTPLHAIVFTVIFGLLVACQYNTPEPTSPLQLWQTPVFHPITPENPALLDINLFINLGVQSISRGISMDTGGDVDTVWVSAGDPPLAARQSGNGTPLDSPDGNTIDDFYLQFNVSDVYLYQGQPTGHLQIEVDYLDQGMDTFSLQYDADATDDSTGQFKNGGIQTKTDSGEFRTATFYLCNAYFGNRDNGADFRISDNGDGAETISAVRVIGLPTGHFTWYVDNYGADPMDNQPDSDAIQTVLDSACSGDIIIFTSGVETPGYQGYLIDKTLFLTGYTAKHDLTFTASDPSEHALLQATANLKGFVVHLYAKSRVTPNGDIKDIDFGYIDVDGGRNVRACSGPDRQFGTSDDNWGSWLPECSVITDPWCQPGNIGFDGFDGGVIIHDLVNQQTECGTALSFGGRGGTVENVTIDTAGDHVHVSDCTFTDNDGDKSGWSDGITLFGNDQTVINNTIINPSDVGIAMFGGVNTLIENNTIRITSGNYGAFAGITVHSWAIADASGVQLINNTIVNEGDSQCGGFHVGINLGPHMWNGGCVTSPLPGAYGNPGCSDDPDPDGIVPCDGNPCQVWLSLPEDGTFTMVDNTVTGAHINYLIEGFAINGNFIDANNTSIEPRLSDWEASREGCYDQTWGPLDKVAHDPTLPGYTDLKIHCTR